MEGRGTIETFSCERDEDRGEKKKDKQTKIYKSTKTKSDIGVNEDSIRN